MQRIAEAMWDPLLCLLYLVVGGVFLMVTRGKALKGVAALWSRRPESSKGGVREGAIPHREAFLSALAASVGVGNLAGVATALHLAGPGALFWMWVSAVLGASFRMTSTYLAIHHRPDSLTSPATATPMAYLDALLPGGNRWLSKVVATLLIAIGLINADLVQSNSIANAMTGSLGLPAGAVAAMVVAAVAVVVLGGVRSVVRVSSKLAPAMLAIYLVLGLGVLASEPAKTLRSLQEVFFYAFNPYPVAGGVGGYALMRTLQYGVSRGIFSHGSGIGIAPFFQAANVDHPARGALLAAAVPLVDTLIVCTVTGLVILSQGFWQFLTSAHLTVSAFETGAGTGGKVAVMCCLVVFAFTTMIAWAHFIERSFRYLGLSRPLPVRLLFCGVAFAGPFFPVALVWSLGDVLIGLLIVFHLLPLTYVTMVRSRTMMRGLGEQIGSSARRPAASTLR